MQAVKTGEAHRLQVDPAAFPGILATTVGWKLTWRVPSTAAKQAEQQNTCSHLTAPTSQCDVASSSSLALLCLLVVEAGYAGGASAVSWLEHAELMSELEVVWAFSSASASMVGSVWVHGVGSVGFGGRSSSSNSAGEESARVTELISTSW